MVAKPAIAVSTGWVYTELDSNVIENHPDIDGIRKAIEDGDVRGMCDKIHNVLEPVTTGKYSVIKDIERVLEDNGAVRAFMTGSGPTVFAVFEKEEDARKGYEAVKESGLAPELFLTKPVNPGK